MVLVVELVNTPDCESGEHGFEPRRAPQFETSPCSSIGKDASLSSCKGEFNSRTGHSGRTRPYAFVAQMDQSAALRRRRPSVRARPKAQRGCSSVGERPAHNRMRARSIRAVPTMARWRRGNAVVCKTIMRRFNPGSRLCLDLALFG